MDSVGKKHEVSLYHHTITGARGAMLDFVEIPDSIGTTTILKSKKIIWFDAGGGWRGSIQIKRKGMSEFSYECAVNGDVIQDNMSSQDTETTNEETFDVKVLTPVAASFGVGSSDVRVVTFLFCFDRFYMHTLNPPQVSKYPFDYSLISFSRFMRH